MRFPANIKWLGVWAVAALLAACGGGGGGGENTDSNTREFFCDSITGGGTQVTTSIDPGCVNCSISDEQSVADDDARTFASMTVNESAPEQGAAIRSTAQEGVVFPKGNDAGAFLSEPGEDGVTAGGRNISVRTYLDGALQESAGMGPATPGNLNKISVPTSDDSALPQEFLGFRTTKTFDAVEIFINNGEANTTEPVFKIHEICSDGGSG